MILEIFYRICNLVACYTLYFTHFFFYIFKRKKIARYILEIAALKLLNSMGADLNDIRNIKKDKSDRKVIYIANHDSPLDFLLVQGVFKLTGITTAHKHLFFVLPFIDIAIKQYGHLTLDHLDKNSRFKSIKKLQYNLIQKKEIFLHPSGSLVTKIQERLSSSVAFLSFKTDAKVIALKINVHNQTIRDEEFKYKPFKYLINRLFSRKIIFSLSQQKIFDPRNYINRKLMTNEMQNFYLND